MGKAVLKHLRLGQGDLITHADFLYQTLNQNPTYSKEQPLVTALKPLSDKFGAALVDATNGGSDRIKAKNKAKSELNQHLSKLIQTIEHNSNGNDAYLTDASIELRKARIRKIYDYLAIPSNFKVINDPRKGVINLSWGKVVGAVIYAIEELQEDGTWRGDKYTTLITMQLSGLELGAQKTFRIRAIGRVSLIGEWSDSEVVWVS